MRRWLAGASALLAACAGPGAGRPGRAEYSFPRAFEASQLVAVTAGGERRELLASVRRSGDDLQVTLFDPVFAVPVLSARAQGRTITEERLAPGPRAGDGVRLVRLLRDVLSRRYAEGAGTPEAGGWAGRVRLSALPPATTPCRFPAEIEVAPRGSGTIVRVRTLDVACE